MERQQVIDGLVKILGTMRTVDAKLLENITEETNFITDLGVASSELINIVAKAEAQFDIEFDDDDVDDFGSTVGEAVDIILKTYNAQNA